MADRLDPSVAKAEYRRAVARLTESVTPELQHLARRLGVALNTVSRWNSEIDPRHPRPGWDAAVAAEARAAAERYRRKATDLDALATELDPHASA